MLIFLLSRIVQAAPALPGVASLVVVIRHLSGDPVALMVPEAAAEPDIAILRAQFGFDRPIRVQYLDYLGDLVRGDRGISCIQNIPVTDIVAAHLPDTPELSASAFAIAALVGVPVGVIAALTRGAG